MHYDLIKSSQLFLRESIVNATQAEHENSRWAFAILHVVQSLELTLKAMLEKSNKLFIYEDIDQRDRTVSVRKAIQRLRDADFGTVDISEGEVKKITKAIDIRNQVTHHEFQCKPEYLGAKFAETFGLVSYLQEKRLGVVMHDIVDPELMGGLRKHQQSFSKLIENAQRKIKNDGIEDEYVWGCPECDQDTFVIKDEINRCFCCQHTEAPLECPSCNELWCEGDMVDISGEFDYCKSDGRYTLANNFGYDTNYVCVECVDHVRETIEEKRQEELHEYVSSTFEMHIESSLKELSKQSQHNITYHPTG